MIAKSLALLALGTMATAVGSCAPAPPSDALSVQSARPVTAPAAANAAISPVGSVVPNGALPVVRVSKSASCGCCKLWVAHMEQAGFTVEVRDLNDVGPVKDRLGVPAGKRSCHTAEVGGYFIEGHVPADDVKRLLADKPDALGLAVPGMPAGSPGMETADGSAQAYTVELVGRDGSTSVQSSYPQR